MANPLHQFEIVNWVPFEDPVFGVDLSLTNSAFWMLLGVLGASTLMIVGGRGRNIVPGRLQNIPEILYEFCFNMTKDAIGKEAGKFFPFVFCIFMTVLMGNVLGLLPGSFTYTSHIAVTAALAILVFVACTAAGFWYHGTHFFSHFLPSGVPMILAPLLIVIEVISYLSRPLTLSVRLFANMTAGHIVVKIFAGLSVMAVSAMSMGVFVGIVPAFMNVLVMVLELMIACIHAYIFTALTCVYLQDAIEMH